MGDKTNDINDNGIENTEEKNEEVKKSDISTELNNKINDINNKIDDFLIKIDEQNKIIQELKKGYKKFYETNITDNHISETPRDKILKILKGE